MRDQGVVVPAICEGCANIVNIAASILAGWRGNPAGGGKDSWLYEADRRAAGNVMSSGISIRRCIRYNGTGGGTSANAKADVVEALTFRARSANAGLGDLWGCLKRREDVLG